MATVYHGIIRTTTTILKKAGEFDSMARRRYTRNEKIFYILSLVIVFSMVLSLIYVAITPSGF
jgi:cell division protein FtsL